MANMNPDDAAERTDPDGHADGHADVAMGPFGAPVFAFVDQAQAAVSAMQALAAGDTRGLDDESLLGMFDAAELIDRYFASVHFAVLAELDARDLTDRRFGHAPATQAGWRHGADRRRVNRDLHCWQMAFNFVPFGYMKSYSFTINAKSSMLKDLRLQKRESNYDNF